MLRRIALAAVVVGVLLAALAPALSWRQQRDQAEAAAARALALAAQARLATYRDALAALAGHLGRLEARPPELIERSLDGLSRAYPAFARVYALDADGRVLALVPADGEGAPRPGEPDLSQRRRESVKAGQAFFGLAGAAGAGERVELAEPVGESGLWLAADLRTDGLAGELRAAAGNLPFRLHGDQRTLAGDLDSGDFTAADVPTATPLSLGVGSAPAGIAWLAFVGAVVALAGLAALWRSRRA